MADFETRTVAATFEMRDDPATGGPILEGYATTFNDPYDMGAFREQIHPAAFNKTLRTDKTTGLIAADVRLLVDHEGQPLARTKSGTLTLIPDSTGLHARAILDPSDPDVQRLLPKMRRGDLDQMSFAFRVPENGDVWEDDYTMRTITEANLSGGDVSVVTYPANPNTSVSVRAEDLHAANWVLIDARLREARDSMPPEDVAKLHALLQMMATADDQLDKMQPMLAAILGVPNPDADDSDAAPAAAVPAPRGRSLELSRRMLAVLDL